MFKAPFSFKGRIRRREYGISCIIYCVVISVFQKLMPTIENKALLFLAQMHTLPLFWFCIAQGTKRCHDRNNPGFFQLFLPIYIFWMLFAEGEQKTNRYGPDPKLANNNHEDILDNFGH